jgi:hypothetical protein
VRFRTAVMVLVFLLAVMFFLPEAVRAFLLSGLEQNPLQPVPPWEQILFLVAGFCLRWQWVSVPILVLLFAFLTFIRPTQRAFSLSEVPRKTGHLKDRNALE